MNLVSPSRVLLVAALALQVCIAYAAPNLVQNGGFETGTGLGVAIGNDTGVNPWVNPSNTGNTIIDITTPAVDHPLFNSTDGGRFLSSLGLFVATAGPVQQEITGLTVGDSYLLKFEWAGAQTSFGGGAYVAGWAVNFGAAGFSVSGTGLSDEFLPWASASHIFVATSSTQVLSFQAEVQSSASLSLLDGVSLTAVPEPSSILLMLAGMSTLAIASKHRRRRGSF